MVNLDQQKINWAELHMEEQPIAEGALSHPLVFQSINRCDPLRGLCNGLPGHLYG